MPPLTLASQLYYAPLLILAEALPRRCFVKIDRDIAKCDWLSTTHSWRSSHSITRTVRFLPANYHHFDQNGPQSTVGRSARAANVR
jgi:hypothetical protein